MKKLNKKVNGSKPRTEPTQIYAGLTPYGSLLYEELRDRHGTDFTINQFRQHVRSRYQWRYPQLFTPEA